MRYIFFLALSLSLVSCFTKKPYPYLPEYQRVFGNRPVYGPDSTLKKLSFLSHAEPVINAGNIYVKDKYLYQVEVGRGIHIIDNTVPANAKRVGFIAISGCSQISIKGSILYSNNYDDMVMVNLSNMQNIREFSRIKNAFPSGRYTYPNSVPPDPGYYECPKGDSLVAYWVKDSIYSSCYNN